MNDTTKKLVSKIIKACEHMHIVEIEVEFDGSGDSGQVESLIFTNEKGEEVEPAIKLGECEFITGQEIKNNKWCDIVEIKDPEIDAAVEHVVYSLLEEKHGGWEINEGSFGTVTFDIENKKITFDYNKRIEEVVSTESEINIDNDAEES